MLRHFLKVRGVDPTFRGYHSPVAFKTKVHPAGTLPLSWDIAGDAPGAVGWDLCPISPPPPSPLCFFPARRGVLGASCPAWPPASAQKGCRTWHSFLLALGCPTRHQSPIFRLQKMNCRMLAVWPQPLAGGRGSLTQLPWFSLSTHDFVSLLLWCHLLSSGSGMALNVPEASDGCVRCCLLVSNGHSMQRNCKYSCKALVLVIFNCSLICDLFAAAFTQEHQSTF